MMTSRAVDGNPKAGQFGSDFRAFGNAMLAQTQCSQDADAYFQWRKLLESEASQTVE